MAKLLYRAVLRKGLNFVSIHRLEKTMFHDICSVRHLYMVAFLLGALCVWPGAGSLAPPLLSFRLSGSRFSDSRLSDSRLSDSRLSDSRLSDSCLLRVAGLRVAGLRVAGVRVVDSVVAPIGVDVVSLFRVLKLHAAFLGFLPFEIL